MPTIIQSFSEERRQTQAANGENKNGAPIANGDASPAVRSMFDFYFPARAEANGASGRSLKRKRRSGRRGDDLAAAEVDLLRFGVDAAKLVPQGLVDRVDVHMSRAALGKVVGNHVTNWCNRSGFAPSFLQEITTLLAAYYPCNYPTLLDEVLAGFLLKRPEFIDLLLPAMLEKMTKTSESVSTTKFPVADALVRMLEHNGDRFVLSPPLIAACAVESSDNVLQTLWRALLPRSPNAHVNGSVDDDELNWRIEDPAQQIVELLAEEGKLRICRISCVFVTLMFSDEGIMKQLVDSQSYLISDCLERAFKYGSTSWSASLMAEWLERRRKQQPEGTDLAGSFKDLADFLARFNLKLSVKKPEWFINHVLSFALSPQCHVAEQEFALRAILRDHMSFVFGGVDAQLLDQKNSLNGSRESSVTGSVATEDLDVVRRQSVSEVRSKIELLFGLLIAANARTSALFLDIWSEVWSDKRMVLSWGYVHALICVVIEDTIDDRSELGQKLQSFTTRLCRSYYHRLSRQLIEDNVPDDVSAKFSEVLNVLLPSARPIASVLLQEVLGALADFERSHAAEACSIFGNAVTLHLGSCSDGGTTVSVKRGVVQKSLVEYDHSPSTTAHFLTTLTTLSSIKNDTGDFTRRMLSNGPALRLLAGLLNFGRRRRRQEMLLDVMNVIVTYNTSGKLNRGWARQYIVQEIMYCAYTGPPNSARKAIVLLENIFRRNTNGIRSLLWVILQQCTKFCCGREEERNGENLALLSDNYQCKADTFAELVKAMIVTVPTSTVREVLSFVEQKLASCSVGKTRVNLFLLLLLRKLIVCELQCGVLISVVQLAVCPLAPSDLDQIRLIQLQLLKALCTRLIAVRHRQVASSTLSVVDPDWKRCEDLVYNERLQSDLRSMVKTAPLTSCGVYKRTNRATEVLAQSILTFTRQLKQQTPIEKGTQRIPKR
ncbi:hypothetical protein PHMEG_00010173 [Phytophthora megakarya]|uniref:Uncharacterized protein n=1 Tax=Phytophthora megakarya TaxID=4795 RepID=A0A225WG42_9STRA|nr:hypothetical protein PHMEG_00010173 [Phytophthora megakarya]